jgi:hypothetical protein
MRIVPKPATRWPRFPLGIAVFVVVWALTVAGSRLLAHYTGTRLDLCLFHRATGYSCPTCGTTRGLLALAHGAWREGFAWNPLTMSGALLGSLAVLGRAITARTLEIELTPLEKRVALFLGLALLCINWAWLLRSHP